MIKLEYLLCFVVLFLCSQKINSLEQCLQDCSTTSEHISSNTLHPVSCSIQPQACSNLENGGEPVANAGAPKRISRDQQWYLVTDPDHEGCQKVALNFSWHPNHDGSIRSLQGYKITVSDKKSGFLRRQQSVYFCINETLSFHEHVRSTFFYDCFGLSSRIQLRPSIYSRTQTKVEVDIQSLPPSLPDDPRPNQLVVPISIPSCDDSRLRSVYECKQREQFVLSLENISCKNRSVQFYYNIPPLFGMPHFGLLNSVIRKDKSDTPTNIEKVEFNSPQGKVVMVLPKEQSLHQNFSIVIYGEVNFRRQKMFNFSHCTDMPSHSALPLAAIVLLPLLAFIAAAIVIAGFYLKWDIKQIRRWIRKDMGNRNKHQNDQAQQLENSRMLAVLKEKLKQRIEVYIIFVDDHPKHKKIVSDFASFLHGDLEFNVTSELFQTEEIYADPATWMEDSLMKADKVIVIWSPGAATRWERYNSSKPIEQDLFTPVLKHIKKDIFRDRNVGKYYFGYFDYCSVDDIPIVFKESCVFHFKLMKQFKELYFRLKGIEMYMPGAIVRRDEIAFDRYFDPKINKFGPALEKSICEMCVYVKENPEWFLEKHHGKDKALVLSGLPKLITDSEVLITHLDLIPPAPLPTSPIPVSLPAAESNARSVLGPFCETNAHSVLSKEDSLAAISLKTTTKQPKCLNKDNASLIIPFSNGPICGSSLDVYEEPQSNSETNSAFVQQDSGFQSAHAESSKQDGFDKLKPLILRVPVEQEMLEAHSSVNNKRVPMLKQTVFPHTFLCHKQNEHLDSVLDQIVPSNSSPLYFNGLGGRELLQKPSESEFESVSYDEQLHNSYTPMIKKGQFMVEPSPRNNEHAESQPSLHLVPLDMESNAMDCLAAINNLTPNVC